MFGDDPQDASKVAASIAKQAADPRAWLEQSYRLKRLADELIQRYDEALDAAFDLQQKHMEQFPPDYWVRSGLQPGDIVFARPGERESEARMWAAQRRAARGSPQVYMMLAGQAVENLVKGLYVAMHPEVVGSLEQVVNDKHVLNPPANGHNTSKLLRQLDIELSETESNIAHRLSLAVQWHGRYPVPMRKRQTQVEQLGDNEESISLGYWTSGWPPMIDAFYERLFAKLIAVVDPDWTPWWE